MKNISGYKLMEKIYESEKTIVYRSIRKMDNLPVILKIMHKQFPAAEEIASFKQEYEMVKDFNSNSVIKAYGLEVYGDALCMAMEDYGGESLARHMKKSKISMEDCLAIALQLAESVGEIHNRGLIHKGINPGNILWNSETGQVKIIDFGSATRLAVEIAKVQSINTAGDILSYIAPEQTGRMNRSVDGRADFYSLGVTFYEMLTGNLPFTAADPMELVHAHIAKQPVPPYEANPQIPQPVSKITMKLLAKMAEDRYQSSFALKKDLNRCLREFKQSGKVKNFDIGQNDLPERLQIPEKLYGREAEVEQILAAFAEVCDGTVELLLVAGYAGIGKSALVHEAHKLIARQRGYFVSGKFDQYKRNIPYASFIQAFRELMQQILGEGKPQIEVWKDKLLDVLGSNGQIIIDVIPEVELIIGEQPLALELGPIETLNRFNLVFLNFIRVFAYKDHPLTLFLDDLQWADAASLQLIEILTTDRDTEYIFVIGAYRDNEITGLHPLTLTLDKLQTGDVKITHIKLDCLESVNILQLLSETLHCETDKAMLLGEICIEKTKGNPFFLKQFIHTLYERNLLVFDFAQGVWVWKLDDIKQADITDNVVDLMTARIELLPAATCSVLKLAASIGNQFDLRTLAGIYEKPVAETASCLWEALQSGLILPLDEAYRLVQHDCCTRVTYRFLHDRVQQAAYAMIPAEQLASLHLKIGRILLKNTPPEKLAETLLDLVNHLNMGRDLIVEKSERLQLASLNLQAGKQAKASNAYDTAIIYFTTAIELLGDERWTENYKLTLTTFEDAAETFFLNGDFINAEKVISVVLEHTADILEKIKIYNTQILIYNANGKFQECIKLGLMILQQLGTKFPDKPVKEDLFKYYEKVKVAIAGRKPFDFLNHATMEEPYILATQNIFFAIYPAVYLSSSDLLPIITLEQVYISLKYGNSPKSAYGYVAYSIVLAGIFEDYENAYQFGQLAMSLANRPEAKAVKACAVFLVGNFTVFLKEHWRNALKCLFDNYVNALESGNLLYCGNSLTNYLYYSYHAGENINVLNIKSIAGITVVNKINQQISMRSMRMLAQAFVNLSEEANNPYQLQGELYDERKEVPLYDETNDKNGKRYLLLMKCSIANMFNEYRHALELLTEFEEGLKSLIGTPLYTIFIFHDSLVRLALYEHSTPDEQQHCMARVAENLKKLELWATHAPMNFAHKVCLVKAEQFRVLNEMEQALDMYDEAIRLAKENEYINEEALANELGARFWLNKGKKDVAQLYLVKAYYCYQRWGATNKLRDLAKKHPQLLKKESGKSSVGSSDITVTDRLDLITIIKASQAIAGEIELGQLLSKMMQIMLENAGAEKGFFILEKSGELVVEAETDVRLGSMTVLSAISLADMGKDAQKLSSAIVQYVFRTQEQCILSNPAEQGGFINDKYIQAKKPKSIMCMPIIGQGKAIGILYLENNLLFDAFTPERIHILEILAAQSAVSLENALLYANLKQQEQEYRTLFENLNVAVFRTTSSAGGRFLKVNPAMVEMFGFDSVDEIMQHLPIEVYPDQAERTKFIKNITETGYVKNMELRYKKLDGSVFWGSVTGSPEYDAEGNIKWIDGMLEDITQRKQTELELQKYREQLEELVEERTRALSDALEDLKKTQSQLVQSEKLASLGQLIAGVAHEINTPLGAIKASAGNSAHAFVEAIQQLPQLYGALSVNEFNLFFKLLERSLNHTRGLTAREERAYKKVLVDCLNGQGLSDINYLANKLVRLGIYDRVEEFLPLLQNEQATFVFELIYNLGILNKKLNDIQTAVERTYKIVFALKNYSHFQNTAEMVEADLKDGLETVLTLYHNQLKQGITVIKNFAVVPLVKCFPDELAQVWTNIIHNAIQAMEGTGKLEIDLFAENGNAVVIFTDDGPGILPENLARIFEPFFTTKSQGEGSGLGLDICQQIIERHKGKIEVESQPGNTAFSVYLPLNA